MEGPSIFLSAGDPSGDNAAARLVSELKDITPGIRVIGLGGPKLRDLGQEQFARGSDLAVIGFWEVARHFRYFSKLLSRCAAEIKQRRPAAVVLVDYPGFNLRLAKRIRSLGIPIVYYISPQVWAWGSRRLRQMEKLVDLMLVILPFEKDVYSRHDIDCRFVGHYLLEDIDKGLIASKPPEGGGLALLPGSRLQEVERMFPVMIKAADRFNRRHGTKAVVAGIEGLYDYEGALAGLENIRVEYGNPRRIVHDAALVLTSSGTATLEAAIIGRPMVVIYRTGRITYQIARRLIKIDKIALVNLVLGEKIVPELIQHEAKPDTIFDSLNHFWIDDEAYEQVRKRLNEVPSLLGGEGASRRAAEAIAGMLR